MKQLTYVKKGRLEWRNAEEPALEAPTDALVRPFVAARCDGDHVPLFHNLSSALRVGIACHYIDPLVTAAFGDRPYEGPYAFGHECVAEVLQCGGDVRGFGAGDRVVVPWSIACGVCATCVSGLTTKCERRGPRLANGYGFGAALGANPIEAPDSARWYRRRAPPLAGGYPITVDAGASRPRLEYAVRCLAPGGQCTSVGYYFYAGTKLPLWQLYVNGGSFHTGLSHPHGDAPEVLRLVEQGKFRPELVTTLLADWDDAPRAFLERTTKVVIRREPLRRPAA